MLIGTPSETPIQLSPGSSRRRPSRRGRRPSAPPARARSPPGRTGPSRGGRRSSRARTTRAPRAHARAARAPTRSLTCVRQARHHALELALAEDLVGDVDVAGLRVAGLRRHHPDAPTGSSVTRPRRRVEAHPQEGRRAPRADVRGPGPALTPHGAPPHGPRPTRRRPAPGIGWYLRRMGVPPAAPDSKPGALAAGRDVARWPGGEVDSLPLGGRDEAELAGRTGFVRLAIKSSACRSCRSPPSAGRTRCLYRLRRPGRSGSA